MYATLAFGVAAIAAPPAFITIGDMGGSALGGSYSFSAASTAAVAKAIRASATSLAAKVRFATERSRADTPHQRTPTPL